MARVLLATIPPFEGGVPAKCALLAHHLRSLGHEVTVAYYATWGDEPELVAPSWRLARGARPGLRFGTCFGDVPCVGVGCWLPELEVTYYAGSAAWSKLIAAHDRHIAVGGNVLVADRLGRAGVPHMVWCGTPMLEDRLDRQVRMPWPRRLLDRMVTVPLLRRVERRVLETSDLLLPVSRYSAGCFAALGRTRPMTVLPVPVDTDRFRPAAGGAPGVVGFAGRLGDPRKNLGLLLEAVALLRRRGRDVRLRLTGRPLPAVAARMQALDIAGHVEWVGTLPHEALPGFYQSLDVFAMPSRQEGLGIVGVEAMACGVPVVSTRNGGAEDYVLDGETGLLAGFEPAGFADRLDAVLTGRALRDRLGAAARDLALRRYALSPWRAALAAAWGQVWGDEP